MPPCGPASALTLAVAIAAKSAAQGPPCLRLLALGALAWRSGQRRHVDIAAGTAGASAGPGAHKVSQAHDLLLLLVLLALLDSGCGSQRGKVILLGHRGTAAAGRRPSLGRLNSRDLDRAWRLVVGRTGGASA